MSEGEFSLATWTLRALEAAKANRQFTIIDPRIVDVVMQTRRIVPVPESLAECLAFAAGYFLGKGWL